MQLTSVTWWKFEAYALALACDTHKTPTHSQSIHQTTTKLTYKQTKLTPQVYDAWFVQHMHIICQQNRCALWLICIYPHGIDNSEFSQIHFRFAFNIKCLCLWMTYITSNKLVRLSIIIRTLSFAWFCVLFFFFFLLILLILLNHLVKQGEWRVKICISISIIKTLYI